MTGFGGAASGFVAGATAATGFLGGALVIAVLAVGLRAGDLVTLALLADAFVAGARFAAIVFADFFAADFFVVFFAAATFFLFFAFFAIIVFPIVAADFPNHTVPISSGCNGTLRLSTQLRPVGPSIALDRRTYGVPARKRGCREPKPLAAVSARPIFRHGPAPLIEIDGRHPWRDLVALCRAQATPAEQQPALFALREDHRPARARNSP
jgi:hypothetical protein